ENGLVTFEGELHTRKSQSFLSRFTQKSGQRLQQQHKDRIARGFAEDTMESHVRLNPLVECSGAGQLMDCLLQLPYMLGIRALGRKGSNFGLQRTAHLD